MNVPFLDLKAQYDGIRDEVRAAVDAVFESQHFILGPQVTALEKELAGLCGVGHAVGVASGTDALLLALKAVGVGPGDAVVTVPFSFFATAGAIVNLGARPLFVDIERSSFNMAAERLAALLERECRFDSATRALIHKASGTRVKAVVPVHLYGQCADMDAILEAARRFRVAVVEDACQSIGARYREGRAGSFGDLGCFSFFPSKNLGGAGDGGMVVSGNEEYAGRVRLLRTHGAKPKYFHKVVGFNSRLDELQAAILRVKLRRLEEWSEARRRNALEFGKRFEEARLVGSLELPAILPNRNHIFHQYVIRCSRRDELRFFLKTQQIETEVYYPLALHEQECFRYLGYSPSDFPCASEAAKETLALPIYPELTAEQKTHIVASIASFYAASTERVAGRL